MSTSSFPQRNRLLSSLSSADVSLLKAHLEPSKLSLRQELERPQRPIEQIYFVESGIASVIAIQGSAVHVEVGLIGCEGMTGVSALLGSNRTVHRTYVQIEGEALRISANKLQQFINASKSMRELLLKYAYVFSLQITHTAIANARARLDQRLARWLLMAHDRVRASTVPLTHEFIAMMLGVRRAGVTEALNSLESQALIEARRGEIVIRDRRGLEQLVGKFYGVPEAEYRHLIS